MGGPLQAIGDVVWFVGVALVAVSLGDQILRWLRLDPEEPFETVAMGGALGLGVLAYVVWLAGSIGFLYAPVGWGILAVAAAVGGKQCLGLLRAVVDQVRGGSRPSVASALLWLCLAVVLAAGLVRSLAPPVANDWDSLQYHLAFPKIYVQQHAIVQLPFSTHSYFPFTMEMLYALGLLTKSVAAAKLLHFLTACLTAATMLAWGRRLGNQTIGLVAAAVFLGTPAVQAELGTGYIDLGITCYTLAALYALVRWRGEHDSRWHLVAGVLAGLCMGCKYTGAVTFGFVGLSAVAMTWRATPRLWRQWMMLALVGAAVGAPWYVKNEIQVGNPVYPFAHSVFHGVRWDQELGGLYSKEQRTYGTGRGLRDLATVPWNLTMWPWNHDRARGLRYEVQPVTSSTVGPLFLALLLPFVFLGGKPPEVRFWGASAAFYFLAWFFMMQYIRYLLPCLAILALCVGWTAAELPRRLPRAGFAAAGALGLFLGAASWFGLNTTAEPWEVVAGQQSARQYLTRRLDMYRAAEFVNAMLPADAKIITYGEPRGYYLDRDYAWGDPNHSRLFDYRQVTSADELLALYASHGITHVLVNNRYFDIDPLLSTDDLAKPTQFLLRFREPPDSLSQHLRDQLSVDLTEALAKFDTSAPPSPSLLAALIEELNGCLRGESLYTPERFDSVALSAETQSLLEQAPTGEALVRLNRRLLDEAYPDDFAEPSPVRRLVAESANTGVLRRLYWDGIVWVFAVPGDSA